MKPASPAGQPFLAAVWSVVNGVMVPRALGYPKPELCSVFMRGGVPLLAPLGQIGPVLHREAHQPEAVGLVVFPLAQRLQLVSLHIDASPVGRLDQRRVGGGNAPPAQGVEVGRELDSLF